MFSRQTEWKKLRIITSISLVLILLTIFFFWAKVFSFLTIVEQVYIITVLFFLFIFAKSIAWYSFVLNLLNTRENLEETRKKLKWNKNEEKLIAILEEKWVLTMLEIFITWLNWVTSILYDIALTFLLWIFIVANATIFNMYILQATILGTLTVVLITWFFDRYANLKLYENIINEISQEEKEINKEEIKKED